MIKENIFKIKERISLVCSRINKDPRSITIVAVSKGRTPEQIKEVIEAGITDIGENRVQEAVIKYNGLTDSRTHGLRNSIKWHMVGHLQMNKAKDAVRVFDLIQSVDSIRLAEEINQRAAKINKLQDILIEIKTSPETAKFGLKTDEAIEAIREMIGFKNINIKGLMTIAPVVDSSEKARPYFRILKELKNQINQSITHQLTILSMGMTDDFEVAIEEDSNMIRLGRVIFEG